jgi:hypothetical protein
MRKDNSKHNSQQGLLRRRYIQALAGTSLIGLAGCAGNTKGGKKGSGGPVSDTISVAVNNIPEQSNVNPWAATPKTKGITWMTELTGPENMVKSKQLLSGHSYDAPWIDGTDTISVPTMIKDVKINPPYEFIESFDDRLTYWDGTPIDAKAQLLHDKIEYYYDGKAFDETETLNRKVVDQWTYKEWNGKDESKKQKANPTNKYILQDKAIPSNQPPFHPDFTKPYVDRLEDASSKKAVDKIIKELGSDNIDFFRLADKGWGSGLYRIESSDEISAKSALAKKRDDHPNEHATIPKLEIQFATADRMSVLINRGKVDIGGGVVTEKGGAQNRAALPDYIQEIQRYRQSGGDQVLFNWNNPHLARLWVRRAIIAAADWKAIGGNGWGPERSIPIENHTGLLDRAAEETFSKRFLDQLHIYPIDSDMALAKKWLKKAEYSKQGDDWVGPDGKTLSLSLKFVSAINDYVGATQTLKVNLESLGINVEYQGLSWSAHTKALKPHNVNYDMMMFWAGNPNIWDSYWTDGHWYAQQLLGGDPNDEPPWHVDPEDKRDTKGRPIQVKIPKQVGSIDAPNKAGRNPNLSNGQRINVAELVRKFRKPDISDEEFTKAAEMCARYYNFYLPDFKFHQYPWGLWGNVRDFTFPPEDHTANLISKGFSGDDYQVLGGITQLKYDTDFEPPK